jgi:hypothetical protein
MRDLLEKLLFMAVAFPVAYVLVLGIEKYNKWQDTSVESEFASPLASYRYLDDQAETDDPYITNKVIAMDGSNGKLDSVYYELPGDLKANTAEEVGTIVRFKWHSENKGRYGSRGYAFKMSCDIALIDCATHKVIGRHHIEGDDPPTSIMTRQNSSLGWSEKPVERIVAYLLTLPRRSRP